MNKVITVSLFEGMWRVEAACESGSSDQLRSGEDTVNYLQFALRIQRR